ncbi:MAG: tRNA(Ile)-lysidine synthase [Candidatus Azotimanducaceae bacterium]|jgi:tRNA(Ile)-lysidine synthase
MALIERFQEFCANTLGLNNSNRILVAISGGRDSVLLVQLLHRLGIYIELAHVNYQLRGEESDGDEQFVKSLAEQLKVRIHVNRVDTLAYKKEHKLSTQEAARDIRYNWFNEILKKSDLDFVAVAHHKDDVLETQLINLSRGTGLKGLRSIQAKRDCIVRPMLCLSREDVDFLIQEMQVPFREDSSNKSDDYLRNKIRHHVIPVLKACEPKVVEQAVKTALILSDTEQVLGELLEEKRSDIFKETSDKLLHISIDKLSQCSLPLLQFMFDTYGGFQASEVQGLMSGQTGKFLENGQYQLLRNRDFLILKALSVQEKAALSIRGEGQFKLGNQTLVVTEFKGGSPKFSRDNKQCWVPASKIKFPMVLRKWKHGDWIVPFGMNGKKLVSDLLVDQKMSKFEKEEILVLVQNQEIIWLVGCRSDERFKVVDASEKLYLFTLK